MYQNFQIIKQYIFSLIIPQMGAPYEKIPNLNQTVLTVWYMGVSLLCFVLILFIRNISKHELD